MATKQRKFADDAWAVWIDGDDTSTVYFNHWINPKGKSYVDVSVHIRGIQVSTGLHVHVPFSVSSEEIEDVSLHFKDKAILQATFSAGCIMDYKKNAYTSEVAYNGKTVDIVHIGATDCEIKQLSGGTLLSVDLQRLWPYLDNDEAYFVWRMPHKSLNEIYKPRMTMGNVLSRLRDLITTPVVTEKHGYSIRINEARLLPDEITRIGAFHRQKLNKAVITIAINEDYELNDVSCYRIRRLEENLYKTYLPEDYPCEDVIIYQWNQTREYNLQGQFNFYYSMIKNAVSKGSMLVYMILLMVVNIVADALYEIIRDFLLSLF